MHNTRFRTPLSHNSKLCLMAVGLLLCLQVIIYKMKAKKHYRRTTGHRQPLSKILITSIAA